MTLVAARELRNHSADLIERARLGEEIIITVNGVPSAQLIALRPTRKAYLTKDELLALRPKSGEPIGEYWEHEYDGDSTDDLGAIE